MNKEQASKAIIVVAPEFMEALIDLLKRYVGLVKSGDCGSWNPEEEAVVLKARRLIAKGKS